MGVLCPLGRNFYLNITPSNLVRLYPHKDAIREGSPTTLKIRELSSKDLEPTVVESPCSDMHLPNIKPPVTNCKSARMLVTHASTISENQKSVVIDPLHKQSLKELVTSVRNSNPTRFQNPSQVSCSSNAVHQNAQSSVQLGSNCSPLSELDSLNHVQTTLKLQDRSKSFCLNQEYTSSSVAASSQYSDVVLESRCMQKPLQVSSSKFHFKRTSTTPLPSQVQSPVNDVQRPAVRSQYSSASVTVASAPFHPFGSPIPGSGSTVVTTVYSTSSMKVEDMWDTGKQGVLKCAVRMQCLFLVVIDETTRVIDSTLCYL